MKLYCVTDPLGNPICETFAKETQNCLVLLQTRGRIGTWSFTSGQINSYWEHYKNLGYVVVEIDFPTLPVSDFPHKVIDVEYEIKI